LFWHLLWRYTFIQFSLILDFVFLLFHAFNIETFSCGLALLRPRGVRVRILLFLRIIPCFKRFSHQVLFKRFSIWRYHSFKQHVLINSILAFQRTLATFGRFYHVLLFHYNSFCLVGSLVHSPFTLLLYHL
jgi:hypothetical protein